MCPTWGQRYQIGAGPFTLPSGRLVRAALRHDSTTIGLDERHALSFDRSGRLIRAFWQQRSVRRSLDNRFIEKRRTGHFAWSFDRKELAQPEWTRLLDRILEEVLAVQQALDSCSFGVPEGHAPALLDRVTEILKWTPAALQEDGARFRSIYLPIPILPPDQYGALVVQVTEGCAYNHCTFCRLYQDRPFRVKPLGELRRHVRAIRDFFGAGLSLRRGVFLADANALMLSCARLVDTLDLLQGELSFAPGALRGFYSFIDAFSGGPKTPAHFQALAQRGLRRVYLGLETGCDDLLHFLCKPATRDEALGLVSVLKAAGVAVGVIVMVGIGGTRYAERHVTDTGATLDAMGLDARDIVYFSPLLADPHSSYRQLERAAGIRALTDAEMDAQLQALKAGCAGEPFKRPKVAVYDIRDFLH